MIVPDRYTQIVLSVIALCLLWICVRDFPLVSAARASGDEVIEVRVVEPVEVSGGHVDEVDHVSTVDDVDHVSSVDNVGYVSSGDVTCE